MVRPTRTIDLNRIEVFTRVVEAGSFTAAAQVLGLPKSSVSRSVALLEEELGTRLLQRSSRKVTVTEAGAKYHEQVARALTSIGEANEAAAELRTAPSGTVRITAPFDAGSDVFVPLIARFVEQHPAIHVDLVLSGRMVDLAEEGFDLAMRAGPIRDQNLVARKIATILPGLFASRTYLARHGSPATPKDLARQPCVIFRGTRDRVTWTLTSSGRQESVLVSGPISVDDMGAARSAMVAGAGIALLPPFTCAVQVAEGSVVRILPEWVGPEAMVNLVYPSAQFVPQRVVLLREFLLKELAKIPWTCTEAPRRKRDAGGKRR